MKMLVSKNALNRMVLCICFLSVLPIAHGAEPITITMTDHWLYAISNAGAAPGERG